jgi:hypothetical protein
MGGAFCLFLLLSLHDPLHEKNRMTVNKGQLVNGQIKITSAQGSTSSYDAVGNIIDAAKYENGAVQNYHYRSSLTPLIH